jgi:hypothetical protein
MPSKALFSTTAQGCHPSIAIQPEIIMVNDQTPMTDVQTTYFRNIVRANSNITNTRDARRHIPFLVIGHWDLVIADWSLVISRRAINEPTVVILAIPN